MTDDLDLAALRAKYADVTERSPEIYRHVVLLLRRIETVEQERDALREKVESLRAALALATALRHA